MKNIIRFLKQPSTVRGLIVLMGVGGYSFVNEQQLTDVLGLCAGLLGIVEVFRDEEAKGE